MLLVIKVKWRNLIAEKTFFKTKEKKKKNKKNKHSQFLTGVTVIDLKRVQALEKPQIMQCID